MNVASPATAWPTVASPFVVYEPVESFFRGRVGEAGQNQICAYLSIALLADLLNATLAWWWADPAAALVIAAVACYEGRESWRGDACDCC